MEGRRAAAAACKELGVREGYFPSILPVEEDEPHIALGRSATKALREAMPENLKIRVFIL